MKRIVLMVLVVLSVIVLFTMQIAAKKTGEEPKVIFVYFSGYRCPPCMKFKLEYLDDFKRTYREKYNGRLELREYITDMPLDFDINSAEYKAAKLTAERNQKLLAELGVFHKLPYIGSIPTIVIGETVLKDETKEEVEAAIDKAIKNNEITKLSFKPLSGKEGDYSNY
jgi:thiol-disulfide isomerase/thioredoxin